MADLHVGLRGIPHAGGSTGYTLLNTFINGGSCDGYGTITLVELYLQYNLPVTEVCKIGIWEHVSGVFADITTYWRLRDSVTITGGLPAGTNFIPVSLNAEKGDTIGYYFSGGMWGTPMYAAPASTNATGLYVGDGFIVGGDVPFIRRSLRWILYGTGTGILTTLNPTTLPPLVSSRRTMDRCMKPFKRGSSRIC